MNEDADADEQTLRLSMDAKATVKVAFDADNPGLWAFHCHNLYHMAAGMFATLVYRDFA